MLKRFFVSLLGTVAGIWISLILVFFGGLMLIGSISSSLSSIGSSSVVKVENNSILYLDLSGVINERYSPMSVITAIQSVENQAPTLDEMLTALKAASTDSKIAGVYINCAGSAMGVASRQELVEAIAQFKQSGKWVYAYSDNYTQGDYIVACAADKVYLNPTGSVDIRGVASQIPFFTGLLDKLGVKIQIIKVGTFKSAVEPFVLKSMSEPNRLQTQTYVDSIWHYMSYAISDSREIANESVRKMASEMIATRQSEFFLEKGLVDELKYRRQVEDVMRDEVGVGQGEKLNLVTPFNYLSVANLVGTVETSTESEHIAVLYAVGDIVDNGTEGIVGSTITPQIIELADDDNVKGLVLRVNSGGGSAFASEQIWEALEYFKTKGKLLYVSMGDYAASGGYYISCGADKIFADATTLTGSIGVFGMIPDFSGLVSGKLGINFSEVASNDNANYPALAMPLTEQQHTALQESVENIYDLFTRRVADGRSMAQEDVKAIAEGRVWVGASAIELGLVDQLGSLNTAIIAMAENLDMDPSNIVKYPRSEEKFWEVILRNSDAFQQAKSSAISGYDEQMLEMLSAVKTLRTMNPIQARMEKVIIK